VDYNVFLNWIHHSFNGNEASRPCKGKTYFRGDVLLSAKDGQFLGGQLRSSIQQFFCTLGQKLVSSVNIAFFQSSLVQFLYFFNPLQSSLYNFSCKVLLFYTLTRTDSLGHCCCTDSSNMHYKHYTVHREMHNFVHGDQCEQIQDTPPRVWILVAINKRKTNIFGYNS